MKIFKKVFTKGQRVVKGQSLIVQFIIFFLIGITLFISLGNLFRIQSEKLRQNLIDLSLEMVSSYVSSFAVTSVEGCMDCGAVETSVQLDKAYVGYFLELYFNESGLVVRTAPERAEHLSSMNNLNETLTTSGSVASIKTINLTYTRNQNKLEVT